MPSHVGDFNSGYCKGRSSSEMPVPPVDSNGPVTSPLALGDNTLAHWIVDNPASIIAHAVEDCHPYPWVSQVIASADGFQS